MQDESNSQQPQNLGNDGNVVPNQPMQVEVAEVSSTQVDQVNDQLQNVGINSEIQNINVSDNFKQIMSDIKDSYELIQSCDVVDFLKNLENRFLQFNTNQFSIRQVLDYTKEANSVSKAIKDRLMYLQAQALPQQQASMTPQIPTPQVQDVVMQQVNIKNKSSKPVEYIHLYQFVSDMAQNIVTNATKRLEPDALLQLQNYNDYSVRIDASKFRCHPLKEIFSCKGVKYIQRHHLKKSQCEYVQRLIAPQGNRTNQANIDFPQFNPDFIYPWTLLFINLSESDIWCNFVGQHRESQLTLPQNKALSERQCEAKFAYNQSCRWLQITYDERLNMYIGERDLFCISNGFSPAHSQRAKVKSFSRCFCLRDKNTGAADGKTAFIYSYTEQDFIKAFNRWHNVSPFLKYGSYKVEILKANVFPDLKDLPPPIQYEEILPIHCGWLNLVKSQLVGHLQTKFCPCIGYGGVYLPKYSHKDFCVTGTLVNSTPRFAGTIPKDEQQNYFQWSITDGMWVPFVGLLTSAPLYEEYCSQPIPSEVEQLNNHQNSLVFDEQGIDLISQYVYGSIHFWTWHKRNAPSNQISLTPMTPYGKVSQGFDPFKPQASDDPLILHLLQPQASYTVDLKTDALQEYISSLSSTCKELSLRYKRSNLIKGYNSPHLFYDDVTSSDKYYIRSRVPLSLELLQMPITQEALKYFKNFNLQDFHWVPKALIQHICEETNTYWPHKRDLQNDRYYRLQAKRSQDDFQPVAKKHRS